MKGEEEIGFKDGWKKIIGEPLRKIELTDTTSIYVTERDPQQTHWKLIRDQIIFSNTKQLLSDNKGDNRQYCMIWSTKTTIFWVYQPNIPIPIFGPGHILNMINGSLIPNSQL